MQRVCARLFTYAFPFFGLELDQENLEGYLQFYSRHCRLKAMLDMVFSFSFDGLDLVK